MDKRGKGEERGGGEEGVGWKRRGSRAEAQRLVEIEEVRQKNGVREKRNLL
jgi:hypothetical protein